MRMSAPISGAGNSAGSSLPSGIARSLSFAAAPTFGVMAVLSASGPAADMICSMGGMPMDEASVFSGMMPMYLLMTLFHVGPWLRLMSGEGGFRRS
ncbi:hypothetical protein FHX15_002077 [Rhizobium sp. BK650]|uniref:hypothetical protein n=1 Tax=Rhizobium sp. BK650 TaxID=2586990 RepID=UPI0018346F02|nr:hypothetical protein [Rhizobium sp. BK650]MBB3656849.1 hypothetical protein [Rhizobium sp. BK650]